MGNPGDVKPSGEGVSEMRIDYGPGYRVYYMQRGQVLIVLLCGGDKSTQAADIRAAYRIASVGRTDPMTAKISRYDVADYLKSEKDMAAYLEACFEEAGDDAAFIAAAL